MNNQKIVVFFVFTKKHKETKSLPEGLRSEVNEKNKELSNWYLMNFAGPY